MCFCCLWLSLPAEDVGVSESLSRFWLDLERNLFLKPLIIFCFRCDESDGEMDGAIFLASGGEMKFVISRISTLNAIGSWNLTNLNTEVSSTELWLYNGIEYVTVAAVIQRITKKWLMKNPWSGD